jgi:hypothetical protein
MVLFALGLASMVFVVVFTIHAATRAAGAGQSPRSAIIEAWFNILVGFSINYGANLVIIPMAIHGGSLSPVGNFWMGWIYTVISIVRQYAIRRWFNARLFGRGT